MPFLYLTKSKNLSRFRGCFKNCFCIDKYWKYSTYWPIVTLILNEKQNMFDRSISSVVWIRVLSKRSWRFSAAIRWCTGWTSVNWNRNFKKIVSKFCFFVKIFSNKLNPHYTCTKLASNCNKNLSVKLP